MPPTLKAGQDVTALMSAAPAPPTSGQDVTALMSAAPTFSSTNEKDASGAATVDPNTLGTFARHVGAQINPVTMVQSAGNAILHPIDTVKAIGAAQGAVFDKAKASYAAGDYGTAARHFMDYLLPLVGPVMDQAADQSQAGHVAAGAGDAVGLGLSLFAPERLASAVSAVKRAPVALTKDAAAVQFGQARGIPIDAATATGNSAIRGVQAMTDRSLGGSVIAERATKAQAAGLTRVGGELATDALPRTVTPEQAGQGIRDALASKLQAHGDYATASYDRLRALEAAAPQGIPVTTTGAKAAIRPVYDQMMRQMPVAQQEMSGGLKALKNILDGPDTAPLSQVDRDLSAIKTIAREQGGLAKLAVAQLETAVQRAATAGGPEVTRSLTQGRRATIAHVATQDLIDALPGGKLDEPLAVFKRATAPADSGIEFLRTVHEHTPQALPGIARAKLEDLLTTATERGGFDHADKLYADWRKLGPETKRLLYPAAGQTEALDQFFLLAKKLAQNPNPSGTGQAMLRLTEGGALVTNPVAFVAAEAGAAGLSAILHSPAGVQALTRGVRLAVNPVHATTAARAAVAAQLVKAAQAAGVALPTTAPSLVPLGSTP